MPEGTCPTAEAIRRRIAPAAGTLRAAADRADQVARAVMATTEHVGADRVATAAGLWRAVAGLYARLAVDSGDGPEVAAEAVRINVADAAELAAELVRLARADPGRHPRGRGVGVAT